MPDRPPTVLRALAAGESGPWVRLSDPDKASRRAAGLLARAGWVGPGGVLDPDQSGLDRLAPWLEALDPATARDYLRRAREALDAAGADPGLDWPTLAGSSRRRSRALDPTELARLLASFPDPLSGSLAAWLALTGARPGEARRTRWRDLDLGVRPVWRVLGTKSPAARRVLPLDAAHRRVLPAPGGPPDGLVWPVSDWAWRRAWSSAAGSSGLDPNGLVPYVLRHTFATRALERGMTYEQVAAWLGHASGDTLRKHYRHAVAAQPGAGVLLAEGVLS